MNYTQKGFTALEAVMVIIVVILLGLGGWYIWDKNKSPQTTSNNSSEQARQEPTTDNDKTDETPPPTYDAAKVAKVKNFERASDSLKADLVGKFYDKAKTQCDAENAQLPASEQHPYYLAVNKMVRDDFAAVIFCPSGADSILAKVNGTWQSIGTLADTPSCSLVDEYKISKEITATCITSSSQTKEVTHP